jgi:phosphoribosyl-ATP pyrophosphohydrolase/phosphoribosyl-AMP cyclohydrolase
MSLEPAPLNSIDPDQLDFEKQGGLLPVVAQSVETNEVLMLAYVNREALEKTRESGWAHYWSRSRQAFWKKGESSGNVQQVEAIWVDCDADTLVYRVRQQGPACHTGARTCFFRELPLSGACSPDPASPLP